MLVGNQQRINEVLRFKSNMDSGMFLPVQLAAAKALELGQDWHDEVNKVYEIRREKVFQLLELLQCEFDSKQAGLFVWAEIPEEYRAMGSMKFAELLLTEAKVSVSPGIGFGEYGDDYVRFALIENEHRTRQAVRGIRKVLGGVADPEEKLLIKASVG